MKIKFYSELYQLLLKEANERGVSIPRLVILKLEEVYNINNNTSN